MNLLDGINSELATVNEINNKLFDVVTLPLYPPTGEAIKMVGIANDIAISDSAEFVRPNSFGVYKNTGGECLGTLGKSFYPTQPKDLFNAFTRCLIEADKFNLSSLNYRELKGGAKVRFEIEATPISFKNRAKKVDDLTTKIILETGFDGKTKTTFSIETLRLICTNGMTVVDSAVNVAFKNTKNNIGKIAMVCDDILKISDSIEGYKETLQNYDAKEVTQAQVNEFIKFTLGYDPQQRAELGTRTLNNIDLLQESIELEFSRTGATAWGLLNGMTHYTNHSIGKDKDDFIRVGAGLGLNNKAQKFANHLVLS